MPGPDALRIALLAYRGNPHSGGQGVYVHHLSRELHHLGHHVEVFSGPPYPDLAPGVPLVRVPSLDLYRSDDPFRTPRPSEFRCPVDVLEFGLMCTAGFPEPLTFSLRAARRLRRAAGDFDIVHDNQCLGYGIARHRPRRPARRGHDPPSRSPSTANSTWPTPELVPSARAATLVRLRDHAEAGGRAGCRASSPSRSRRRATSSRTWAPAPSSWRSSRSGSTPAASVPYPTSPGCPGES